MENCNLFESPNSHITEEDRVRSRIIRQNPRPSSFYGNSNSQLPSLHSEENGIQVKNRFQHRDKSLSLIGSISKRKKLHHLNHDEVENEMTSSREEKRDSQAEASNHDCYSGQNEDKRSNQSKNAIVSNDIVFDESNPCKSKTKEVHTLTGSFCKSCGEYDCIALESNFKKCVKCNAYSLANSAQDFPDFINSEGIKEQSCSAKKAPPRPNDTNQKMAHSATNNKQVLGQKSNENKRKAKAKAVIKEKICLTISSDEEESESEKDYISGNEIEVKELENNHEEELAVTEASSESIGKSNMSKFSSRMKPQGGKVTVGMSDHTKPQGVEVNPDVSVDINKKGGKINAVKEKENEASVIAMEDTAASCAEEVNFEVPISRVKFGLYNGLAISEMYLEDYCMKVDIECSYAIIINGASRRTTEKYKLALGNEEVMEILINDVSEPLMICVVPTKRYSDIVNAALKKKVLEPRGEAMEKRQIIFFVDLEVWKFKKMVDCHIKVLEKISDVQKMDNFGAMNLMEIIWPSSTNNKPMRTYSTRSKQKPEDVAEKYKNAKTMFVYPPPPQKGGIAVTTVDIDCLKPGIYLNDTIIDFYLKYLVEEKLDKEMKQKTYLFNSYFYTTLIKKNPSRSSQGAGPSDRMYHQVKKWTRNVDIFEKDYVIIPVNEHAHWYLVIICFPGSVEDITEDSVSKEDDNDECVISGEAVMGNDCTDDSQSKNTVFSPGSDKMDVDDSTNTASLDSSDQSVAIVKPKRKKSDSKKDAKNQPCILIFDSLVSGGRSRVFSNLRQYLTNEWKEKRGNSHAAKIFNKNNIKGSFPKIPLQTNDCDCGVYVLQFAESFFKHPITNYKPPIKKEDWFTTEVVENKRGQIKDLIFELLKTRYTAHNT